MDSFSLLKYWRGVGVGVGVGSAAAPPDTATSANVRTATTIATSALRPSSETDDDEEGSFFDLELAVPNEAAADGGENDDDNDDSAAESDELEEREELNFTVSSSSSDLTSDPSLSLSPSDDLFFKGRLVPLEPSSIVIATSESADSKPPQFPVSLLKSATKFRVFMLGLKKPKSASAEPNAAPSAAAGASPKPSQQQISKFFIKFKVEEVPIVSLFSGSRNSGTGPAKPTAKPRSDDSTAATAEEKKFTKETVQKYINKIKPLYVRVSKRYGEKMRFSGQLTAEGAAVAACEPLDGDAAAAKAKMAAGLKVVRKRLGKSKSASSAVAAVPSPPVPPQRRDDSLLQQQDGIQGAIAHCKRSFNAASKGSESPLVRSKSDPGDDRSECT